MSYHLKLIKAISYTGNGITATKQHPDIITENKTVFDALTASGYFRVVKEEEQDQKEEKDQKEKKILEEMTVSELESFAAYKGVSLKGVTKKVDIITKLKAELGEEELKNEVDYGSPTMTDLQE